MNEIQVPQEYIEKSKTLVKVYDDFVFSGESLDKIITEMREILIDSGFSKTQAMMKISEDHRHLRSFSLNNIYKVLPKEEKQQYSKKPEIEDSSSKNFYQNGKNEQEDDLQSKIPPERPTPQFQTADTIQTGPEAYFGSAGLQDSDELLKVQKQNEEPIDESYNWTSDKLKESNTEIPQNIQLQLKENETNKQLLQEERIKSQDLQTKLEQKEKEYDKLSTKLAQFQEIKEIDIGLDELVPFRILVNPAAATNRIPSITPLNEDTLKKIKRKLGR